MASKVEELRENLLHMVAGDLAMPSLVRIVDSLISVAHAEGKAEGAEQEGERIRKTGEFIKTDESMSGQEGDWASLDEHRGEIEGMSARCDLFITRAAVLAPTKEGK